MKPRYRLFRRGWGVYYAFDNQTGKQESLGTRHRHEAQRLVHARNEAQQQPLMNWQIARAYLNAGDPAALTRTWQSVMDEMGRHKRGVTGERWTRAVAEQPFDLIRNLALPETRAAHRRSGLNWPGWDMPAPDWPRPGRARRRKSMGNRSIFPLTLKREVSLSGRS